MTIIINPVSDLIVNSNIEATALNLLNYFDDPTTTGLIANFQLYNTSLGNGVINIVLFDQDGAGAPLTVQNFLNYVSDGDYINSIIHRSIPNFIIQGGGFTVEQLTPQSIPSNPPVQNEFSPNRSNLPGTIAMAKLGGNPNSATNQWFFNLANNASNLDNQNGGFTVFGQVLSNADLLTLNVIAAVPVFNRSNLSPVFSNLPLLGNPIDSADDYVRFSEITVSQANELQFTVLGNSNPNLVNVTINGQEILLDYLPNQIGTAEITIIATNLLGEQVQDSFTVTVFDPAQYGASNPDLIPVYGSDLVGLENHYLTYGKNENRSLDNFDEFRYIASSYDQYNGDLINVFGLDGAAATLHYINNGLSEQRSLTAFDPARYLNGYDDLLNAPSIGTNTLAATQHYIQYGFNEQPPRDPNLFASDRYIASWDDLIDAFAFITDYAAKIEAGSNHYLFNGKGENRGITFDPNAYLANPFNADVAAHPLFGTLTGATQHYIQYGFGEGRPVA
jgi:cyclophilin family peptidyl-prolyl cis-trans isomerase